MGLVGFVLGVGSGGGVPIFVDFMGLGVIFIGVGVLGGGSGMRPFLGVGLISIGFFGGSLACFFLLGGSGSLGLGM